MGALAGFTHVFLTRHKANEAQREGKRDLLAGYRVETAIFLTEGIAGTVHGTVLAGEAMGFVEAEGAFALTVGVVASAMCFVSFAGAVVFELWAEGQKRNVFQRFVNQSVFGAHEDESEEAVWASGRSFSAWKKLPSGLRRQRETLTMLFANFSMTPTDRYGVDIHLGATPPGIKLKVTFTHGDQEFPSSHRPEIQGARRHQSFRNEKRPRTLRACRRRRDLAGPANQGRERIDHRPRQFASAGSIRTRGRIPSTATAMHSWSSSPSGGASGRSRYRPRSRCIAAPWRAGPRPRGPCGRRSQNPTSARRGRGSPSP